MTGTAMTVAAATLEMGVIPTGAASVEEVARAMTLLRNHQGMMPTDDASRRGDRPPPVPAILRVDALRLGTAFGPAIAAAPPCIMNGEAWVRRVDGRPGWGRRDRLSPWTIAASPGLRRLPTRMSGGVGWGSPMSTRLNPPQPRWWW